MIDNIVSIFHLWLNEARQINKRHKNNVLYLANSSTQYVHIFILLFFQKRFTERLQETKDGLTFTHHHCIDQVQML